MLQIGSVGPETPRHPLVSLTIRDLLKIGCVCVVVSLSFRGRGIFLKKCFAPYIFFILIMVLLSYYILKSHTKREILYVICGRANDG